MMFEQLIKSVEKMGRFSDAQKALLESKLKLIELSKDAYLINEGKVCQDLYFLDQGCLRHFTIRDSGVDATLNLFIPGDWCLEYKSFVSQQPSENIIQASDDCRIFALSIWDFHALARLHESFFQLGRILEQTVQPTYYQSNHLTPEQKYEHLLSNKPALLQHFPLKHIASYLGMTPETLSRVRKKISS